MWGEQFSAVLPYSHVVGKVNKLTRVEGHYMKLTIDPQALRTFWIIPRGGHYRKTVKSEQKKEYRKLDFIKYIWYNIGRVKNEALKVRVLRKVPLCLVLQSFCFIQAEE